MTAVRATLLDGSKVRQGSSELIDDWSRDGDKLLWIDIQQPDDAALEPLLEERFGFHELAAEDSLSPNTLPKYDPFPGYDFFIFRAVDVNVSQHGSQTYKFAAFLSRNFLITVHRDAAAALVSPPRLDRPERRDGTAATVSTFVTQHGSDLVV